VLAPSPTQTSFMKRGHVYRSIAISTISLVGPLACHSSGSVGTSSPTYDQETSAPPKTLRPKAFFESEAELRSWYRAQNPLNWYGVYDQIPPHGFVPPSQLLLTATFPGNHVGYVKAFEVGGDETAKYFGDECLSSGTAGVLAPDGTLCPEVLYGGKLLSREQATRLLAIAEAPSAELAPGMGRPTYRCGDLIDISFVFYSTEGVPIGLINIDSFCSTWQLIPSPARGLEGLAGQSSEEHRVISNLCSELDLESCKNGRERSEQAAVYREHRKEVQEVLFRTVLSEAPPVRNLPLKDLNHLERVRFCAWSRRALAAASRLRQASGVPSARGTWTIEATGRTLQFVGIADCAKEQFEACTTTAKEAAAEARRVYQVLARDGVDFPAACTPGLRELSVSSTR
jgi:hypothetical protein